ncbi:MAG: hypothetical protein R3E44_15905 [Paracoccaceae bacterium]
MIITTNPANEGHEIVRYDGVVTGEAVLVADTDLDCEGVNDMLTVSASGTAVTVG